MTGGIMVKSNSTIMKIQEVLNQLSNLQREVELLEKKLDQAVYAKRNKIVDEPQMMINKLENDFGEFFETYMVENKSLQEHNYFKRKVV
jgi:hypothetical protein